MHLAPLWGGVLLSQGLWKIMLSYPPSGGRPLMPDSTACHPPPTQPLYLTLSRGLRSAWLPDSHRRRQGAAGQGRDHLALGVQQQLGGHSLDLQALGRCWGRHASRVHYPRKCSNNLGGNTGTPRVRQRPAPPPTQIPTLAGRDLDKSPNPSRPKCPQSKVKDSHPRGCLSILQSLEWAGVGLHVKPCSATL